MQKNAFRFMIKQIKCYNCHRVMLVQKWEAIFQMIYFMTYLGKYFIKMYIAELSVLKAMVQWWLEYHVPFIRIKCINDLLPSCLSSLLTTISHYLAVFYNRISGNTKFKRMK